MFRLLHCGLKLIPLEQPEAKLEVLHLVRSRFMKPCFFSTFRLPPWAKPRPNARITAWFCSVTRCWFSVASMVTTGWAWGRFGCGRVCEISVEILGLHITLPTVSDYQYPGRFGVGDFHLRCFDVLKLIFYEFQGGILSQSGQSSAKNPEGLGLLPSSMVRFNPQVQ